MDWEKRSVYELDGKLKGTFFWSIFQKFPQVIPLFFASLTGSATKIVHAYVFSLIFLFFPPTVYTKSPLVQ